MHRGHAHTHTHTHTMHKHAQNSSIAITHCTSSCSAIDIFRHLRLEVTFPNIWLDLDCKFPHFRICTRSKPFSVTLPLALVFTPEALNCQFRGGDWEEEEREEEEEEEEWKRRRRDRSSYHLPSVFRPKFPTAEYFRTMVPLAMIPPGWIMLEPPKEFYRSRGKEQDSRGEGFKEPETIVREVNAIFK